MSFRFVPTAPFASCTLLAALALLPITGALAQSAGTQKAAAPAAKSQKIDALTPAKKRVVDAFVDSLELAPNWPNYVEESQQAFADDVRAGIVAGAQLDRLPEDKRAKVDAVVDEMIPHIVQDMKTELLKVDAVALYRDIGYEVYGKHFTTQELKTLTAIYSSPFYHRAMPVILEQKKQNPDLSDDDLRKLIGNDDFAALVKAMHSPAYTKLLKATPAAAEATSETIGTIVGNVSERVGKNYSPILLEKLKDIMQDTPENAPVAPQETPPGAPPGTTPANAPTSVKADSPPATDKA